MDAYDAGPSSAAVESEVGLTAADGGDDMSDARVTLSSVTVPGDALLRLEIADRSADVTDGADGVERLVANDDDSVSVSLLDGVSDEAELVARLTRLAIVPANNSVLVRAADDAVARVTPDMTNVCW